jgi:hypothetical protein
MAIAHLVLVRSPLALLTISPRLSAGLKALRKQGSQESIDHYYFSISLKDQKVFADLAPIPFDRMMGRNILAKSVGELASAYHPSLKRFISSSGRTGIAITPQ